MLINTGHISSKILITDNKIKEIKDKNQNNYNEMNKKVEEASTTSKKLRISVDKSNCNIKQIDK